MVLCEWANPDSLAPTVPHNTNVAGVFFYCHCWESSKFPTFCGIQHVCIYNPSLYIDGTPSLIPSLPSPLPCLPLSFPSLSLTSLPPCPWCAADAIDENYGVAVVFHEEEGDEGAKMENVVSQEQDPTEVSRERGREACTCTCTCTAADFIVHVFQGVS